MSRFWSDVVHKLTPYVPGEQPKLDNLVKLNTNENPYGPSPKVIEALKREAADTLRLYPDPNSDALRAAIAQSHRFLMGELWRQRQQCLWQKFQQWMHRQLCIHRRDNPKPVRHPLGSTLLAQAL